MMVTIHGLPVNIKYQDLKVVIKQECKIVDFILDNLVIDSDGLKKVRVGLADDSEGAHVIKCLDGFRMSKYVLRVKPVGKSGVVNQLETNQRGFPSQTYQGTGQPEYGRSEPRMEPWSQSQWTPHQQMGQQQNTYNYQQGQPINNYAPTGVGQQIRPQFDQRQSILSRIGPPSQGFAFAPKNDGPVQNVPPARQGVLRNVEIVDTAAINRQPSNYDMSSRPDVPREKSDMGHERADLLRRAELARNRLDMPRDRNVIMKDNFQGPEYSASQKSSGHYQDRDPWGQPSHQKPDPHLKTFEKPHNDDHKYTADKRDMLKEQLIKQSGSYKEYDKGQFSPHDRTLPHQNRNFPGRNTSPPGRRFSPPGRRISPPVKRMHPSNPGISPHERRISPGRHVATHVRHYSPSQRRNSPSRGISPQNRRISPQNRRISPPPRRVSPSGGILAAPLRRSPMRRMSPGRQSPIRKEMLAKRNITGRDDGRRPGQERYSPSHIEEGRPLKEVRPAYEPTASNQAMYSGGYRPNVTDPVQYPQGRQERSDRYSDREKPYTKHEDDRREPRMSKFDSPRNVDHPRAVEPEIKKPWSQHRDSRSPRRDRSPIRDRYRRHSPSPRSPRRSWALEKRRSPEDNEAPPPPSWPGLETGRVPESREKRPYPDRLDDRPTSWEKPKFEPKAEDIHREPRAAAEEKRVYEREQITIRKDLLKWKPIGNDMPKAVPSRFDQVNERDIKRKEYEARQQDYRQTEEERRPRLDRREFEHRHEEDRRYKTEYTDSSDFNKIKEELSRRIEKKTEILKKQEELQKEIEDVYKRAVDFTKKAELYKKGEHRREQDYSDERRRDDHDSKYYERRFDRDGEERRMRDDMAKKPYTDRYREDTRRPIEEKTKPKGHLSPSLRAKRDKASEEISEKLLNKYGDYLPKDIQIRALEELKYAVNKIFYAMYQDNDVSFIEMVVKFNSRYNAKDEEKIFDDVMKSFPSQYRKRPSTDDSGIPSKLSKPSSSETDIKDETVSSSYQIPNWDYSYSAAGIPQMIQNPFMTQQFMMPMQQFIPSYTDVVSVSNEFAQNQDLSDNGEYTLYLCKDDFQTINGIEADTLKEYIIEQMVSITQNSIGWAPDFTIKGLQSPFRYEVVTCDEQSKNWLLHLDFSTLPFNILVYTKEELWYERAAVWLPGHSKCRKIEPLTKLKLQNKYLEGVNIENWKLVRKIVTAKGTRLYVDMPPSSARALEKHKMMLSYELQKVNVFLKAVAVDKDAFDAGLKEASVGFIPITQSTPMPSVQHDPNAVKFCLKGDKPITLGVARKIKDAIVYSLFKYHQNGGNGKTDFTKYGFINPGYFGVLPENSESRQWLLSIHFGTVKSHPIVVMGADDDCTRFIKMSINLPSDQSAPRAVERLRSSNQGVKGINFHKWKNLKVNYDRNLRKNTLAVDMDIESVETIIKINYQLDYVKDDGARFQTLKVRSDYSTEELNGLLQKYKKELSDTYVVENMEITSNSGNSDEEVVCLD